MNEKRMGTVILILLIVLNLVLFGYDSYQSIAKNWVPKERIEQVKKLYVRSGISIIAEPERKNESRPILILKEANLEQMAETYLDGNFEKSFIYGSKVQYTSGERLILTDRKNHSITYTDQALADLRWIEQSESIEEWAEAQRISEDSAHLLMKEGATEFAKDWLGDDIELVKTEKKGKGFEYTFHSVQEDTVMYFNKLKVWMLNENVISAEIVFWEIVGEEDEAYTPMPIDEILYALLGNIKKDMQEGETDEVIRIRTGYQLVKEDEKGLAVPSITVMMRSGREYVMNCTAVLQ